MDSAVQEPLTAELAEHAESKTWLCLCGSAVKLGGAAWQCASRINE